MIRLGAWDFGFVAAPLLMEAFLKSGSVEVVFWFRSFSGLEQKAFAGG